jgi:hypothetical protein
MSISNLTGDQSTNLINMQNAAANQAALDATGLAGNVAKLQAGLKPVACADHGILNWYAYSKTAEKVDLYAIPDTHRVVPVELLERLLQENYLSPDEGSTCIELVAIIEDKP